MSTLLDLLAGLLEPDQDLDGDGDVDQVVPDTSTHRVGRCIHEGQTVPAKIAGEPWTCALQPEMRDGYSVAFEFDAVGAQILGIGN
jgi:hypothetical protein